MADFNPNELLIEKVRAVEEYDIATNELQARYTQIEDPTLNFTADDTQVTDAEGTPIADFYKAQQATFAFTNSLFSLDLAATQLGSEKKVASSDAKIKVPVSEVLTVGPDGTVTLSGVPVGASGAEVKYAKVINSNNTFGATFEASSTAGDGKFTVSASDKKLTFPTSLAGSKVFVNYVKESASAISVTKTTDSEPPVRKLLIHVIFRDPCNKNLQYAGIIEATRAQIDPTNIEMNLTPDGKHAANYLIQKEYCNEDGRLVNFYVYND